MPQISVIVPVYKVEKYLSRCVDSILAQTFTDYEIILIDDGSPDRCGEMVDEYARKDERIIALHQENQGLSVARNSGIDIASGKYITFIDSDDYVYPEYLKKLLEALLNNDADISICGNVHFENNVEKEIHKNFNGEKIYSGIEACKKIYTGASNQANYVIACGKLYKREFFSSHRYPRGKIHEDLFLTYKIMYDSKKVVEVGDCLYAYYINMQGITKSLFRINRYDGVEALEEAEAFFERKKEQEIVRLIAKERLVLIARNSINARNAKIYNQVPKCYRMNFYKAKKIIKELSGVDCYEYFMFQYYPRLVTFEARIRKLRNLIKI